MAVAKYLWRIAILYAEQQFYMPNKNVAKG